MAAAAECLGEGAFGGNAGGGFGVVERGEQGQQVAAVFGDFDAERALSGGGQAFVGGEDFADAAVKAEALQAGGGEDDGIVFAVVEFGQAGFARAAQGLMTKYG